MVMGSIKQGTEVLIIGGGPGGYVAAARAAALGKDVTLVEMAELGGTCLQRGCIPSKALISAAGLVHKLQNAGDMGITATGVKVDGAKLQEWKRKVIARLTSGVGFLLKQGQVNVVRGRARFVSPGEVAVDSAEGALAYTFKDCIIATGSVPVELPFLPYDGQRVLDAGAALDLAEVPANLVVVGGGYIGLELGIMLRKLGASVTVIEALDQILTGVDPDLVGVLQRKLRRLGITVHVKARVRGLADDGLQVTLGDSSDVVLPAGKVLVSVGRRPMTAGLNLEATGVAVDEKGYIKVDDQCRTSLAHLYAIGDVAGGLLLAHKASRQGLVAAEAICGKSSACDWVAVPAVVYTDPEIAWVGMGEAQARAAGYEVAVSRFNFTANGRALTLAESDGLVKIVADQATGTVLGVHMVGPEVSELAAEATLALEMGATAEDLASTIHPHPSLSEALMEAAQSIFFGGRGTH